MTRLAEIFLKPIDRPIEGVIKADDQRHLRVEVEEYVLTDEVKRQLTDLLEAYAQPPQRIHANGVWISGFFGSGKSHLLKMLSLLLSNQQVAGRPVLDAFLEKARDDAFLQGALRKAVAIPSQSILFNIDQQADLINKKKDADALLAVFVKVFNRTRGYFGKQGYIARFERYLDRLGLYDAFKAAYAQIAGKDWERGREEYPIGSRYIDQAYAQVTGEHIEGILREYRADYRMSIEDFAEEVRDYLDAQEPEFRLNFFVDEVGQFIAGNVRLMTNLQTIAESLATRCQGRAWVFVTAQEEMDSVIGGMVHREKGQDFSKIQDRFRHRIKLTSQNVAEVIRIRLLAKNERGQRLLHELYVREKNNLGTLFRFPEGGRQYRTYRDETDFIGNYPFVPYQFTLFQEAIKGFSEHDAFEGKHRSVGERSMLDVFRTVALHMKDQPVGRLATFDMMYKGIRSTLKSQFQRSILNAENHLQDPFVVTVLKALFLVKYVKEFQATPGNLAVLLIDRFDVYIVALQRQVVTALDQLEQEVYVQRNGDEYEFLTDAEKDVEREIKNTEWDVADVRKELERMVFDQILRERKIHYPETGQFYPFSRRLDGRLIGREYELGIHVISPFHDQADQVASLQAQNMLSDEVLVLMAPDPRLIKDLILYRQTEKYVAQNLGANQNPQRNEILQRKRAQNLDRYKNTQQQVRENLARARLFVGGEELSIRGEEPKARIVQAFYALIARAYPNLTMLHGASYAEAQIDQAIRDAQTLFAGDLAAMSEAEQEVLNFIRNEHQRGLRPTMQALVNHFTRKPYGWDRIAVQVMAARIIARGHIEAQLNAEPLEGEPLIKALKNTHIFQKIILTPQIDFSPADLRKLKDFYADFFNREAPAAADARTLARDISQAFRELATELAELLKQQQYYPFLAALEEPLARIEKLIGKRPGDYLDVLHQEEDALFEMKEQVIDPVRAFMNGSQREIYDRARRFLQANRANLDYIDGEEAKRLRSILDDGHCFHGNKMREARQLQKALEDKIQSQLQQERAIAVSEIEGFWARLSGAKEFSQLTEAQQQGLRRPFDNQILALQSMALIPTLRDAVRRFEEGPYTDALRQMDQWLAPPPEPASDDAETLREREVVSLRMLRVPYSAPWLDDEADVDAYLSALRQTLLEAIREGKRVRI